VIDGAGKGMYAWNAPQGVPIGDKRMEVDRRERGMLLIGWQSSVARHPGWGKMGVETPMLCMPIHQNWTHPESKGRERNYVHGVKGRPR